MNLGQIEWKQNGKKAFRLHGLFPYNVVVQKNQQGTYDAIVNGHLIQPGITELDAAQRFIEDWVRSAMITMANSFGNFLQVKREKEFGNGVSA